MMEREDSRRQAASFIKMGGAQTSAVKSEDKAPTSFFIIE
jgi:hypothetical protein